MVGMIITSESNSWTGQTFQSIMLLDRARYDAEFCVFADCMNDNMRKIFEDPITRGARLLTDASVSGKGCYCTAKVKCQHKHMNQRVHFL